MHVDRSARCGRPWFSTTSRRFATGIRMKIPLSSFFVLGAAVTAACSSDNQGVGPGNLSGMDAGTSADAASGDGNGGTVDAGGSKRDGGEVRFKRHTVDPSLAGPAYASVADMDHNGKADLVISSFGTIAGSIPSGQVRIYKQGDNLDAWTVETIVPESEGVKFPNQNTVDDIDGDGDLDVLVPAGFFTCNLTFIPNNAPCGALLWYERTQSGGFTRHVLTEGEARFYHHGVL